MMSSFSIGDLCALTLTNAIASAVAAFVQGWLYLLGNLFVRTQQFGWSSHRDMVRSVLKEIEDNMWVSELHEVFDFRVVPAGWVIGRRFRFMAHINVDGAVMTIKYMTWRWMPPVCIGAAHDQQSKKDEIDVIRHSGCKLDEVDYFKSSELACPMGCPSRRASELASERMLAAWKRDGQGRFVLQGTFGCGKSTAARLLTQKIHGCIIYPTFDPTEPGESLAELMRYINYRNSQMVVVIEEFDVVLRKIVGGHEAHHSLRVEVSSKAGWNNMMDSLQFQSRIIMVLTTNATTDELNELDRQLGGGLFRAGRVTEWIRFDDKEKMV